MKWRRAQPSQDGEWTRGGATNCPACYVGGIRPVVKARFGAQPADLASAVLGAEATGVGFVLEDLPPKRVAFSGGFSDWVDFDACGGTNAIPVCVRRQQGSWEWNVTNVQGRALAKFCVVTSGPHKVYTVLAHPTAPWREAKDDPQCAWAYALEHACGWADSTTTTNAMMMVERVVATNGTFAVVRYWPHKSVVCDVDDEERTLFGNHNLLTTIGALLLGNSMAEPLPMNTKVIANSVVVDRGMEIARLKGLEIVTNGLTFSTWSFPRSIDVNGENYGVCNDEGVFSITSHTNSTIRLAVGSVSRVRDCQTAVTCGLGTLSMNNVNVWSAAKNVNGVVISARQWAIMTLYNGAGGTHPLSLDPVPSRSTPIHFLV